MTRKLWNGSALAGSSVEQAVADMLAALARKGTDEPGFHTESPPVFLVDGEALEVDALIPPDAVWLGG